MPQPRDTVAHDSNRKETREKKREQTSSSADDSKLDRQNPLDQHSHAPRAAGLGVAAAAAGSLTGAVGKAAPPPRALPEVADEAAEMRFVISDQWDIEPTKNEQVDFFID